VDIKTKKNAAGSRQSSLFKELKFRVDSTTTLNATCLTLKPPSGHCNGLTMQKEYTDLSCTDIPLPSLLLISSKVSSLGSLYHYSSLFPLSWPSKGKPWRIWKNQRRMRRAWSLRVYDCMSVIPLTLSVHVHIYVTAIL
jgi:hypothetical protein